MRLEAEECRRRAQGARFAVLATRNASGDVDLVPITFALHRVAQSDRLITAVDHKPKSTTRLARLANIEREPAVSLLFDARDDGDWSKLWWVRARGLATIRPAGHHAELLVARYRQYAGRAPAGPVIEVAITHWQGWSAS